MNLDRTLRVRLSVFVGAALFLLTLPLSARELMSREQALATALGKEAMVERNNAFLTGTQVTAAEKRCSCEIETELVPRYTATKAGKLLGWAYFDAHRVRTLPEILMIVVKPDGAVASVEILSFQEPMDYFPSERWLAQFSGRKLDEELSLRGGIRPISGATLTGRAITGAVRKILAIHAAIESGVDH